MLRISGAGLKAWKVTVTEPEPSDGRHTSPGEDRINTGVIIKETFLIATLACGTRQK